MNIDSISSPPSPLRRTSPPDLTGHALAEKSAGSIKPAQPAGIQIDPSGNGSSDLAVEDAVKRLADFVSPTQSEINFSIDEESGIRVVKILDSQSNEVIRQIPSEEAIELARALDKLQGLFIKDKA